VWASQCEHYQLPGSSLPQASLSSSHLVNAHNVLPIVTNINGLGSKRSIPQSIGHRNIPIVIRSRRVFDAEEEMRL
jgi:hypothetical protein